MVYRKNDVNMQNIQINRTSHTHTDDFLTIIKTIHKGKLIKREYTIF